MASIVSVNVQFPEPSIVLTIVCVAVTFRVRPFALVLLYVWGVVVVDVVSRSGTKSWKSSAKLWL